MNIDQIKYFFRRLRLANVIERNPDHFDMATFFGGETVSTDRWKKIIDEPLGQAIKHCGTTACIAGWACVLADPATSWMEYGNPQKIAAEYLGLEYRPGAADRLFYKWSADSEMAAECLRNLAFTNEVDWEAKLPTWKRLLARLLGAINI
jgi:hypothetical protein